MSEYVIDACALIAYLDDEDGAAVVEELFRDAESSGEDILLHEINLLEVYYGAHRAGGLELAEDVLETVQALPLHVVKGLGDETLREAGRLKATYRVSLADSIAAAEARVRGCALVSADHHELDVLDYRKELKFLWIR